MALTLGSKFENFQSKASFKNAVIDFDFYQYLGDNSWMIFFSHPNDFTPVCTTELRKACQMSQQFAARNCKLVCFSCNTAESHVSWDQDIMTGCGKGCGEHLPFPIVADPKRELAAKLGIMDPVEKDKAGLPVTCRSVFFIAPDRSVRSSILYPATTGRNFDEILRVLDSLQITSKYPVATPVNWNVGDECIVVPTLSDEKAKETFSKGVRKEEVPSGKNYMRYAHV